MSSMKVGNGGAPTAAASLLATASRKLAPPSEAKRHQFQEAGVLGEAQILETASGFELKGISCADGLVANCVINFAHRDQQDWAIATWQSLQPTSSVVKTRPWWRIW